MRDESSPVGRCGWCSPTIRGMPPLIRLPSPPVAILAARMEHLADDRQPARHACRVEAPASGLGRWECTSAPVTPTRAWGWWRCQLRRGAPAVRASSPAARQPPPRCVPARRVADTGGRAEHLHGSRDSSRRRCSWPVTSCSFSALRVSLYGTAAAMRLADADSPPSASFSLGQLSGGGGGCAIGTSLQPMEGGPPARQISPTAARRGAAGHIMGRWSLSWCAPRGPGGQGALASWWSIGWAADKSVQRGRHGRPGAEHFNASVSRIALAAQCQA